MITGSYCRRGWRLTILEPDETKRIKLLIKTTLINISAYVRLQLHPWPSLVVQFPARGSTQVLLCLFPGVLWLWHFLYTVAPHSVSCLYIYTLVVSRAFMAGVASKAGDADSSPLVCRGPWMSTVVLYCWCHSDSASVLLYFTWKN